MTAVWANLDFVGVTGIEKNTALSAEEWQAILDEEASEKHKLQATKEHEVFEYSYAVLSKKGLLEEQPPIFGDRPICVLKGNTDKDYEKMYHAGVEAGHGTEEQRERYREVLRAWKEKDVRLQKYFFENVDRWPLHTCRRKEWSQCTDD